MHGHPNVKNSGFYLNAVIVSGSTRELLVRIDNDSNKTVIVAWECLYLHGWTPRKCQLPVYCTGNEEYHGCK